MSYLAIARQWRPQTFEDLVGQPHVVQTLRNAILQSRVHHAYLFSGARGIGKTSAARIFAKALRCPNAKDAIACQVCSECQAIAEGRSVDVIEIDGASNNGVEAVRAIRDNVVYSAATGFYKIYIIDEVHMLSVSAFNALLKTLEEPPSHVVFLFATTEAQKIPLTVLGRCQRFEFRRLSQGLIIERLKLILIAEKKELSCEGLGLIASGADGSLRDALSLLDQVLSYSANLALPTLDETHVISALGISENRAIYELVQAIVESDKKSLLRLIGDQFDRGVDLKHFTERCYEEVRLLYLVRLTQNEKELVTNDFLDISPHSLTRLSDLAKKVSLIQVERMAQIFAKTISDLNWSSLPRFVLELATIRMSELQGLESVVSPPKPSPQPHQPGTKAAPELSATKPGKPEKLEAPVRPAALTPPPAPVIPPAPVAPPAPLEKNWENFAAFALKKKPRIGALAEHAKFELKKSENGVVLRLHFEGSFYERQASDPEFRKEMEALANEFFASPSRVLIGGSDKAPENKSLEAHRNEKHEQLKREALEHPLVVGFKEALGAEVIEARVDK